MSQSLLNYDFQQTLITKFKLLQQTRIFRVLRHNRVFKRIFKSHPPSVCSNWVPLDEILRIVNQICQGKKYQSLRVDTPGDTDDKEVLLAHPWCCQKYSLTKQSFQISNTLSWHLHSAISNTSKGEESKFCPTTSFFLKNFFSLLKRHFRRKEEQRYRFYQGLHHL